jgi:hypothetical protein
MKWLIFSFAALALFSCANERPSQKNDAVPVDSVPVKAISDVQPYRPNIDYTPWEGDLYDAIYWRDSKGENALIISGKPQYFWEKENPGAARIFPDGEEKETLSELTEIFAVHFVLPAGEAKWKEYHRYHDYLFGCCDVWLSYQPRTLQVVDTDADGHGEVIFLYHETEGDGMLEQNYTGHLILKKDSTVYSVEDVTGKTNLQHHSDARMMSPYARIEAPASGAVRDFLLAQWPLYYREKLKLDSLETRPEAEQEHSHEGHQH